MESAIRPTVRRNVLLRAKRARDQVVREEEDARAKRIDEKRIWRERLAAEKEARLRSLQDELEAEEEARLCAEEAEEPETVQPWIKEEEDDEAARIRREKEAKLSAMGMQMANEDERDLVQEAAQFTVEKEAHEEAERKASEEAAAADRDGIFAAAALGMQVADGCDDAAGAAGAGAGGAAADDDATAAAAADDDEAARIRREKEAKLAALGMQMADDGRFLTLPDGRTLYATQDGWANVAAFGQDGKIDDANRVWKMVDGVLTLSDGRQLYTSAGGAGLGKLNQYSNTSTDRRVFKFVEHGGQRRPVSPLTVLTDLSRWEVIEGHCFNTHFPVNSGGVHTEKEMEFVRHECLR